ncbi:MAG: hydrogenase small subunit [Deltaproteobacteria bacterium]|nr:hydrogenase small subunit [Deltaproteobacteria bacterium]
MDQEERFYEKMREKGVSRRDFMRYSAYLTAAMGLSSSFAPKVAEVFAAPKQRPPVIWLHFAECTGCTESAIKTSYPWIDELIFEVLSIEYHETIMAAAGHQAEKNLFDAVEKYEGKFICIAEGAIAVEHNGVYGKTAGKTHLEIAKSVIPNALATICLGTCAAYGGIQAAKPNPGGFKSVSEALGIKTLNIPGCPPDPVNLVGTIINYIFFGRLPDLDDIGRPLFAYGETVHDKCPRRSHYEDGEFVEEFGSEEAKLGYCLYKLGCKGPDTYSNCPLRGFNDTTNWCIGAGTPCKGCVEPNFWDTMTPFYKES